MHTPVHRPENIHRSLMHVLSGLIVLALIQTPPWPVIIDSPL